jgi:hypothetical protein
MKKRNALIAALCVAGLLLIVLLRLPRGSQVTPRNAATAVAPTTKPAPEHPFLPLADLVAEGNSLIEKDSSDHPDSAVAPNEVHSHLDEALAAVLDSDPQLRKFYNLRRKTLRTAEEQQDYFAMISDPKLIAAGRKDLLDAFSATDVDQSNELRRLQRIQFMNSALGWGDNPERTTALEAVSEVVMVKLPEGASNAVLGSLLGDKFDLFQLLMVSDPAQADALLAQARGTRSERVLQLAWSTGNVHQTNQTP